MKWKQVKELYPNQWVVVEALEANTTPDSIRHIEEVAVIEKCENGRDAMEKYRRLHSDKPYKEYYFFNTRKDNLDIEEHRWLGVRC